MKLLVCLLLLLGGCLAESQRVSVATSQPATVKTVGWEQLLSAFNGARAEVAGLRTDVQASLRVSADLHAQVTGLQVTYGAGDPWPSRIRWFGAVLAGLLAAIWILRRQTGRDKRRMRRVQNPVPRNPMP